MIKLSNILQEIQIKQTLNFKPNNNMVEFKWGVLLDVGNYYADFLPRSKKVVFFQKDIIDIKRKLNGNYNYFIQYFDLMKKEFQNKNYIIFKNKEDIDEIYRKG